MGPAIGGCILDVAEDGIGVDEFYHLSRRVVFVGRWLVFDGISA